MNRHTPEVAAAFGFVLVVILLVDPVALLVRESVDVGSGLHAEEDFDVVGGDGLNHGGRNNVESGRSGDDFADWVGDGVVNGRIASFLNAYEFSPDELTPAFSVEVMRPSPDWRLLCSDSERVLGIEAATAPTELREAVDEALLEAGWIRTETGNDRLSVYVKNQGVYRWVALQSGGDEGGAVVTMCFDASVRS